MNSNEFNRVLAGKASDILSFLEMTCETREPSDIQKALNAIDDLRSGIYRRGSVLHFAPKSMTQYRIGLHHIYEKSQFVYDLLELECFEAALSEWKILTQFVNELNKLYEL